MTCFFFSLFQRSSSLFQLAPFCRIKYGEQNDLFQGGKKVFCQAFFCTQYGLRGMPIMLCYICEYTTYIGSAAYVVYIYIPVYLNMPSK